MVPGIDVVTLILITLCAAVVNGALGYGFSSITVPVALLFYTNRVLNPALILVEVVINGYVLLISRKSVPVVWKRVLPMFAGLVPGIVVGSYVVSSVSPAWLKLFVYAALLPLILLQAAGVRRPIHSERLVGIPFGAGVGILCRFFRQRRAGAASPLRRGASHGGLRGERAVIARSVP